MCKEEDFRRIFFQDLKDRKFNTYNLTYFVIQFEEQMTTDSVKYGLDPEATPGEVLKELT